MKISKPQLILDHIPRIPHPSWNSYFQIYEMYVAGFEFFVLNNAFTNHWGFQSSKTRPHFRAVQQTANNRKFEAFARELDARYGRDPYGMMEKLRKGLYLGKGVVRYSASSKKPAAAVASSSSSPKPSSSSPSSSSSSSSPMPNSSSPGSSPSSSSPKPSPRPAGSSSKSTIAPKMLP